MIRITYKTSVDWDELGRSITVPLRQIMAELAERVRVRIISGQGASRPYPPKMLPQPSVDRSGRAWVSPGWEQPQAEQYRLTSATAAPDMEDEHETSAAKRRDWSGWAVYPSLAVYHTLLRADRAAKRARAAASLGLAVAATSSPRWVREGHLMARNYRIQIMTAQRGRIYFAGGHPAKGLTAPRLASILARQVGQNLLAVTPQEAADVTAQIGESITAHIEATGLVVNRQMKERSQLRSLQRRVAKLTGPSS